MQRDSVNATAVAGSPYGLVPDQARMVASGSVYDQIRVQDLVAGERAAQYDLVSVVPGSAAARPYNSIEIDQDRQAITETPYIKLGDL